jgi:predicted O-methyltransferase YrrM
LGNGTVAANSGVAPQLVNGDSSHEHRMSKEADTLVLRRLVSKIMTALKESLRVLFVRSRFFRLIARFAVREKRFPLDFSQILALPETTIGPVHRDEALALFGITRVLCPRTIVEFGFSRGRSTLNFLLASGPECRVFSFDIDPRAEEIARRCFGGFKNFRFIRKSQSDFSPDDIENRQIDFCFIDASHDLTHNLETFDRIRPHLAKAAIIGVHDTNVWRREFLTERHYAFMNTKFGRRLGRWIDKEQYQPSLDDRLFANYLLQKHPDFARVHLHSSNTLRNGITLLQKLAPLDTGSDPEAWDVRPLSG